MEKKDIDLVCNNIRKGSVQQIGSIVFNLESEFVYEYFKDIIKAISSSKMTDDQIGGLIDYLRDVYNSYEFNIENDLD